MDEGNEKFVDSRLRSLRALSAAINGKHGNGTVVLGGAGHAADIPRLRTGSILLDSALGGGVPVGRMTMFQGKKSCGKTTTIYRIAGIQQSLCSNCLRETDIEVVEVSDNEFVAIGECDCYVSGAIIHPPVQYAYENKNDFKARLKRYSENSFEEYRVALMDQEGSFDLKWATGLGLDARRLLYFSPETAEEGIDIYDSLLRTGAVDLLLLDSIAAMTPSKEVTESAEKWQQGLQARLVNKYCVDGDARVVLEDGTVKTVREVVSGDRLRSMMPDGTVEWQEVKSAWSNGVKSVCRIGDLFLTEDHRVRCRSGYVEAGRVVKGDPVAMVRVSLAKSVGSDELNSACDEHVWWSRESVELNCGEKEVFDIEMIGEPNFEVNGYIVHNCRRVQSSLNNAKNEVGRTPTLIWINQERDKIGVMFGDKTSAPGGHGQEFLASVWVKMWANGYKTEEDPILKIESPISVDINFKITKNKTAPPRKTGRYKMLLTDKDAGKIDDLSIYEKLATKYGEFERVSGTKWRVGMHEFKTKTDAIDFMMNDKDESERLRKLFLKRLVK